VIRHSDPAFTFKLYVHDLDDSPERAVATLAAFLDAAWFRPAYRRVARMRKPR